MLLNSILTTFSGKYCC